MKFVIDRYMFGQWRFKRAIPIAERRTKISNLWWKMGREYWEPSQEMLSVVMNELDEMTEEVCDHYRKRS